MDESLDSVIYFIAHIHARGGGGGGGYSCVRTNGYVRLTGISFLALYEQEGCTKMGTTEQEGSLK